MKATVFSLIWAVVLAGLIWFCASDAILVVASVFSALHINFVSLCMINCDDYRDKMLTGMVKVLPAMILSGLGLLLAAAVFVAFFLGAPLFFVIKGRKEM